MTEFVQYFLLFFKEICDTSDNPQLFMKYFNYLDGLKDHETPDYDHLVQLFASDLRNYDLTYEDFDIRPKDNDEIENDVNEAFEMNENERK